jgi:hypothetical protein
MLLEERGDRRVQIVLKRLIRIDEAPTEGGCQNPTDTRFSGSHEAD